MTSSLPASAYLQASLWLPRHLRLEDLVQCSDDVLRHVKAIRELDGLAEIEMAEDEYVWLVPPDRPVKALLWTAEIISRENELARAVGLPTYEPGD